MKEQCGAGELSRPGIGGAWLSSNKPHPSPLNTASSWKLHKELKARGRAWLVINKLISNVLFVGLYIYFYYLRELGYVGSDIGDCLTLAMAFTIAGNLTILGTASNIVIEALESKFGITVTFREFIKVGAIVTTVNMLVYMPSLFL